MDLNATLAFVTVVECGAFSDAARLLDIPRSTVSARVAALEAHLGAVLLRRTTRRIALTDDGRAYYDRVAPAIAALREAEDQGVASVSGVTALAGSIRMSVPFDFPFDTLSEAVVSFRAAHPQIRFDILVDDSVSDFVDDNLDMAIRGGNPGGDHVIARRIASFSFGRFVNPAYGKAETPDAPQLAFRSRAAPAALPRSAALNAPAHPVVATNSFALLKQLAIKGAGVAVLPEHACEPEVARGELVRWALATPAGQSSPTSSQAGLYLVYPSRRELSPRVKAFSDHLVNTLEAHGAHEAPAETPGVVSASRSRPRR
ncbi:LysR family transcriptional regulator [Pandoraea sp. PE-S2T-3]|uniref:LysR family transcriptional regulator n=1 Tax=Pandoraea sp. PE-S2T-3 TaxID=1986993 RepID=UPI001595EDBB|nr:LysR family transcriptional regulator [Pandoraea sp. PE-S2T-3]